MKFLPLLKNALFVDHAVNLVVTFARRPYYWVIRQANDARNIIILNCVTCIQFLLVYERTGVA